MQQSPTTQFSELKIEPVPKDGEEIPSLPSTPHTKYNQPGGIVFTESMFEEAKRYDAGKTSLSDFDTFFDPDFAEEIGRAFRYGAKKYGKDNWKKGMSWSRCLNSARRHLLSWWRGETIDDESGCHHLALLICSIMFLFVYERDKTGKDDR